MDIVKATRLYEEWVEKYSPIVPEDFTFKHEQMRSSAFAFFRATFYRWSQLIPDVCSDLAKAQSVLAVGDLHVENFGTWRDAEGRLIWGVNDFDEATYLPFTFDLIRLAVSIALATTESHIGLDIEEACESLLGAYRSELEIGGKPFVLAESHSELLRMASGELRGPVPFWEKMSALPILAELPFAEAHKALTEDLPDSKGSFTLRTRRAGLGSLGRPRYVALAEWRGGWVAREVKTLTPSAALWAKGGVGPQSISYMQLVRNAIRCQDPFLSLSGKWIARRLAPDCSRIELHQLPAERDELRLIEAMGRETANIHLGSYDEIAPVRAELRKLPKRWLVKACASMVDEVRSDFKKYVRSD